MPRPIWSGSIAFGLVNVPVKLYSAFSQREVRFNMLHGEDGGRIRQKRVCIKGGHEVPFEEVVKGYEVSPDHFVVISPEELEALDPEATRTIDIEDFVSLEEIDPIYWEHTYYLVPDRGAAKAYALLHQALQKSGRVGIARVVMRTKQYLCTLRPLGRALALSTMQYADEIVPAEKLEGLPAKEQKPDPRELEMAEQLVESLTTRFEPEKYRDDYRERVLELIERKATGKKIVVQRPVEAPRAKVVNLMEALEASLAKTKRREGAEEKGERRLREEAARERRKPRKGGRKKTSAA
ncbi:MAG: Ku protein [Myxococcales bacterium]|nr:Ku protein [Myxococcales bacterium]